MKSIWLLLLFIPSFSYTLNNVDKEKREIILECILGDELKTASEAFFERQVQYAKSSHPDLSDSVWDDVRVHVNAKSAFLDTVIELYQSKLTIEELREIKKAFDIPAMKKVKIVGAEVSESFPTMAVGCGRKILNTINEYLDNHSLIKKK